MVTGGSFHSGYLQNVLESRPLESGYIGEVNQNYCN